MSVKRSTIPWTPDANETRFTRFIQRFGLAEASCHHELDRLKTNQSLVRKQCIEIGQKSVHVVLSYTYWLLKLIDLMRKNMCYIQSSYFENVFRYEIMMVECMKSASREGRPSVSNVHQSNVDTESYCT